MIFVEPKTGRDQQLNQFGSFYGLCDKFVVDYFNDMITGVTLDYTILQVIAISF